MEHNLHHHSSVSDTLRQACRRGISLYSATLLQLFIALFALWLTRAGFYFYNSDLTGGMSFGQFIKVSFYGLRFDLSALAYFNTLFVLMRFWPSALAWRRGWIIAGNTVYAVCNSLMLLLSIGDIPFYRFTGSRLRWHTFLNMWSDSNMFHIIFAYLRDYWWTYLLGLLAIFAVICTAWLIRIKRPAPMWHSHRFTLAARCGILAVAAVLTFIAMRGRVGAGHPLAIGDAVWYVSSPSQINVVLNTPFCVLRSMSRDNTIKPMTFFNDNELKAVHSSVHRPRPEVPFSRKNVVLIAIESGGTLWLDSQRVLPINDDRRHLMPFLDSLARQSLTLRHAFATGKSSIEGVTGVFAGFPTFDSFLYLSSPYNNNIVDSPARLLQEEGYTTKFYFGGNHGSYGIDHLMHIMGFETVTTRDTFGADAEYDGQWGVYDHEVAAYMARDLSTLPQPFMAGWFTLKPHGPWTVSERWKTEGYLSPAGSLERCVEYEDRAIKEFFDIARTQPWYDNTLFVITADHGCRDLPGSDFDGDYMQPHITMMFYTPDGSLTPRLVEETVASQFDIAPTLLSMLGYPKPFVAVGRDIWHEAPAYAINFINGMFQIISTRYMVQLDSSMKSVAGLYEIAIDPTLRNNLLGPIASGQKGTVDKVPASTAYDADEVNYMITFARAFMQDYTHRLTGNRMSISTENDTVTKSTHNNGQER